MAREKKGRAGKKKADQAQEDVLMPVAPVDIPASVSEPNIEKIKQKNDPALGAEAGFKMLLQQLEKAKTPEEHEALIGAYNACYGNKKTAKIRSKFMNEVVTGAKTSFGGIVNGIKTLAKASPNLLKEVLLFLPLLVLAAPTNTLTCMEKSDDAKNAKNERLEVLYCLLAMPSGLFGSVMVMTMLWAVISTLAHGNPFEEVTPYLIPIWITNIVSLFREIGRWKLKEPAVAKAMADEGEQNG